MVLIYLFRVLLDTKFKKVTSKSFDHAVFKSKYVECIKMSFNFLVLNMLICESSNPKIAQKKERFFFKKD